MAYPASPPQGLEQRVAEAQRDQVLDRLLAQVVIDAIDLLLREDGAHAAIDELRRSAIVAERLLEHDTGFRRDDPGRRQVVADLREQARSRRQIQHPDRILAPFQGLAKFSEVAGLRGVHLHIIDQGRK